MNNGSGMTSQFEKRETTRFRREGTAAESSFVLAMKHIVYAASESFQKIFQGFQSNILFAHFHTMKR